MPASALKRMVAKALAVAFFLALPLAGGLTAPAVAASPAETFVADNVQKGVTILNNASLSKDQRRAQLREFLLSITDVKWIADYTLGVYRRTASPEDLAAYEAAFKDYAVAVYQSYFNKYTGQTIQVKGSYENAPGEIVVKTVLLNPNKPDAKPLGVNFKVLNEGGRFYVVDLQDQDSGVWIGLTMRESVTSQLGQNNGQFAPVIKLLKNKAQQIK